MRRLDSETVRYRVGFTGWVLGLPFPDYQPENPSYDRTVAEATRVLAVLPRFGGVPRHGERLATTLEFNLPRTWRMNWALPSHVGRSRPRATSTASRVAGKARQEWRDRPTGRETGDLHVGMMGDR